MTGGKTVSSSNHHNDLDELLLMPRTSGVALFIEEDSLNEDAVASGEEDDEDEQTKMSEFCAIFARSMFKSFSIRPEESADAKMDSQLTREVRISF